MAKKPRKPRKPAPHHTGGFGGLGNTKFPGGTTGGGSGGGGGGGGGGKGKPPRRHHTGGFGGLGNTKFPKRPKRHPKRHLAGPALDGWWITGGNDVADNCAAVAVANSLLLATGLRLVDAELLRLHDRAGPLSIPEALAALGAHFTEVPANSKLDWDLELVTGLATPHGPHAALLLGGALVTWGGVTDWPDDWLLDELWEVRW